MATNESVIHLSRPTPLRTRRLVAGAITALLLAVVATAVVVAEDRFDEPIPVVEPGTPTRAELIRDLVNRGLIPVQALEPAVPSRADVIRDLVNRGFIPRQSLDTPLPTREDVMRDLINRGLVPAEASVN